MILICSPRGFGWRADGEWGQGRNILGWVLKVRLLGFGVRFLDA